MKDEIRAQIGYHNYYQVGTREAVGLVQANCPEGWTATCDTQAPNLPLDTISNTAPAGAIRVGQVKVHDSDPAYPLYVHPRRYGLQEFAKALDRPNDRWTVNRLSMARGRGQVPAPEDEAASGPTWSHGQVQRFKEARKTADWTIDFVAGYADIWTDDPKNQGLDEAASADRYVALVRDALRAEYPLAEVAVSYASRARAGNRVTIHAAHLTADEECVREDIQDEIGDRAEDIADEIHRAGQWYVRLTGATPPIDHPYEIRRPWLPKSSPERWEQAYVVSRHQTWDAANRAPLHTRQGDTLCGRDKDGTWNPIPHGGPSRPDPDGSSE